MEFRVRAVAGVESCFVSLPLLLIQTLESTRAGLLPEVLTLELRSRAAAEPWYVAWSGATSSSPDIEIAKQFAECISLPDHATVQVRAATNLPKATLVTIEPHSEDDWEVLELNAELAEMTILKQIRIVQEAMTFPLWLNGQTIITFHVVSTIPKNSVVQLVPRSEVAVAPKRRNKNLGSYSQSSTPEHHISKAQLRLQDPDATTLTHKTVVRGVELGVGLTSVAFIHPETAKNLSLDCLQLVAILPRLSAKESIKNPETDALRMKNSSASKEGNTGNFTEKKGFRQAIVHLLLSESVAKGHIMISKSVRLYLRASLHSWVYLKGCNINLKKDIPTFSLSPCHFKVSRTENIHDKKFDVLDGREFEEEKSNPTRMNSSNHIDAVDWSIHDEVVAALAYESLRNKDEESTHLSNTSTGLQSLLQAWFLAQLDVLCSNAGAQVNSLVLANETLLHFEIKECKFGNNEVVQTSSDAQLVNKINTRELPAELLYVLSLSEQSLDSGRINAYELCTGEEKRKNNLGSLELFSKLNLCEPVSFPSVKDRTSNKEFSSDISSLSWLETTASDVIDRLMVLLSPASGICYSSYNLPLPGHVLIYGPPGSGKTLLANSVAKFLEESEGLLAHIVFVRCSGLALEKAPTIRQILSSCISEALDHAPSVVIFDDLDSIISSSSDPEGSQTSTSVVALTEFLTDIVDEYGFIPRNIFMDITWVTNQAINQTKGILQMLVGHFIERVYKANMPFDSATNEKRKSTCGIGPIAFMASAQSLANIPQSLSSSGRFDFHIQLPAPAASERKSIIKHEIQRRSLQCSDEILLDVASKCDGYDAYDLEILVDRAVHAAIGRFLPSQSAFEMHEKPSLIRDDFTRAMHDFLPVAMRDITKSAPDGGRQGWDDVGGLNDIRNAIIEMVELPSKYPDIFAKAPLRLRSNVLLYGPPGCGKTHIVGAAAAGCSLRFISVKGPELLNKYIGASEQAVRDIFSKAAAAAPCLLFFDEFDSIAPKRGHDNTGVTDRVVNQFLTELDGVEVLTGVFVFAATSRPDLLDAALLRPGRLDRLLFCDFPSPRERLDILTVLARKLPLASDVDLDAIADMAEGFSGADLQALLSDAQLAAVHEFLGGPDSTEQKKMPIITDDILRSVASKARPSVSDAEKRRLYDIYSQFLDSKRSLTAQSRDTKGKKATLA